ncbi:KH domain-containing protein [Candidatus Microgenomates bacterium]|nr:KH domain-containing protein [Candidatus Microgenomates bacterium]
MEDVKTIKKLASELLELVKIEGKISVEKNEETIKVAIETEQSGAIIGYHGEALVSLQLILNLLAHKALGVWPKIVVNVGDYREKREEYLKSMAENIAERVKTTGRASILTDLSSFERRIVHLALSSDSDVESFSEGEGKNRHLVIKPKNS